METNNLPQWNPATDPAPDVHVVGGGLAGLVAAARVARAGRTVVVHDGRGRLGGRATTDERDGFLFNQGPHAFYRGGPGERILADLGVAPRGVAPELRGSKMALDGQLHLAPGGPGSLAATRLLGVRDKAAVAAILARLQKLDPAPLRSTTVREWVGEVADRPRVNAMLHALVRLTSYADAPDVMSADVALTQLQLGLGPGVLYLAGGWQQLVDALRSTPAVRFATGSTVQSIDELPAPVTIVAVGSPSAAANLVGVDLHTGPEATVATLDVALAEPPRNNFVLGIDEPMYLSCHGSAGGMSPDGMSSISAAEYHLVDTDGSAPATDHRHARARLRRFADHAGFGASSVVTERFLHRMTATSALPTATAGGLTGRPPVEVAERPGVFVAGDWVGPDGHLADASIASGDSAARAAIHHLDRTPAVR